MKPINTAQHTKISKEKNYMIFYTDAEKPYDKIQAILEWEKKGREREIQHLNSPNSQMSIKPKGQD